MVKKARPSLVMKRPSWLAATSEVGGAPLGMQDTQTILPGRGFVGVHLEVAGVVVLGDRAGGDKRHVAVVGGDLHPAQSGCRCRLCLKVFDGLEQKGPVVKVVTY